MKELFLSDRDLIAALRMLLCRKGPLAMQRTVTGSASGSVLSLPSFDNIGPEGLRQEVDSWFARQDQLPDFVQLGEGASYALSTYGCCEGRMVGKVVVVTGGAKGFGAGLAKAFHREGALVVIADLDGEQGRSFVGELGERARYQHCDVSDLASVEAMVTTTVEHFGGLDVMISNAGILFAGGLDEMSPETFALMTRVNYEGYFNCAKAAAGLMKLQAEYSDSHFFDIIQINSKSGLKGSNKNFAYAGGKFGGIGLTQSFALELMPHRIKVNSICPGNFFEGPLWSDPDKGLFVQYLEAGKVPGAKCVEDVKAFYEAQVPAGRGCGTEDVARAAFYAIEQLYETGQAIPVTGGQNMLN